MLSLFIFVSSYAQKDPKVKFKKGIVTVDGVPFLKVEKMKGINARTVYNMQDEKLFFFRIDSYTDIDKISDSNPKGNVSYSSVFQGEGTEVLFEYGFGFKPFGKLLLEFEVIDDNGQIIEENLEKMAAMVGMEYSRNRDSRR
ncbi:MAG: hypothetical protein AB8F74_10795 [Saprospiraceae bacterium]